MKPGDLFITKPDHSQKDGDHFKANEVLILVSKEKYNDDLYDFTSRDRPELKNSNYLSKGRFIPYIEPVITSKNRFNLIFED